MGQGGAETVGKVCARERCVEQVERVAKEFNVWTLLMVSVILRVLSVGKEGHARCEESDVVQREEDEWRGMEFHRAKGEK